MLCRRSSLRLRLVVVVIVVVATKVYSGAPTSDPAGCVNVPGGHVSLCVILVSAVAETHTVRLAKATMCRKPYSNLSREKM